MDYRRILKTQKTVEIIQMSGMEYYYFGLTPMSTKALDSSTNISEDTLRWNINISLYRYSATIQKHKDYCLTSF